MKPSLLFSSAILLFLFSLGSSSTDDHVGVDAVIPPSTEVTTSNSVSSSSSSSRPSQSSNPSSLPEPGLSNLTASNETLSFNITASNSSLSGNVSSTTTTTTTTTTAVPVDPILPHKGAAEEERHSSMAIFFVLSVIGSCILLIHFLLETKFSYIPESLAVVFLGAAIGLVMKLCSANFGDWKKEETLSPTMFFLVLLPPIMYESGYTLHKGNFFQNIGSILVFAIIGTSISAFVIGGGVYVLGVADVAYRLSFTEAFAFGSLISAVDPVATLAIFHALNLDPILNMLVFGESILNDAVAIVLATTALELNRDSSAAASNLITANLSSGAIFSNGVLRFLVVFFGSALVGVAFALIAALIFKYIDLRKHPSLEFGMMLIFIYSPYGLAEGLHLSGIMAILFNGVVMSHYAHFNLSPVTQITMQQTLRTLSFIAETCVFAYLGLAIFSFHMKIELSLIVWSIILCLLGRAMNIYPLSYLVNYFREHKISKKMAFVMWFSGLRGAIAYALALHLDFEEEKRRVVVTTTLIIVLFTIIVLGGSTMPMLKYMNSKKGKGRRRRGNGSFRSKRAVTKSTSSQRQQLISLSKTKEMGTAIETEHLSELTEEEFEVGFRASESNLKGFVWLDARYLMPIFTRRFTEQEVKDCKSAMTDLTNRWYDTLRRPEDVHTLSEDNEEDDDESSDGEDLFTAYQKVENIGLNNNNNNNVDDDGCYPADDEEGRIGTKGSKSKSTRQSTSSTGKKKTSSSSSAAILNISSSDSHLGSLSSSSSSAKVKLLPTRNAVYKKLSNSSSQSSRSATSSSNTSLLPRGGSSSSRMPPAV